MAFQTPQTVEQVLKHIFAQDYLMPAIQREFVWDTDDIVKLFDSLLRGYPVGSFLFWDVEPTTAEDYVFYSFLTDYHEKDQPYAVKKKVPTGTGTTAILDGQQRLTSLNIGLYGSHAVRRHYGRQGAANAYQVKHLYLNLVDAPPDEELGLMYDLRFLTKSEAKPTEGSPDKWFLVGEILKLEGNAVDYIEIIQSRAIVEVKEGVDRLDKLFKAIRSAPSMNYFLVHDQDPNRVLEIFIRVNSGGEKLTNSDLLLSMATNQWSSEPGAREEVRSLVTELNSRGFNFSKDFVLKTALMIVGADVRFQVSNFTKPNMRKVESSWPDIRAALILAVDLLHQSGFSARTLTAGNAAIVIAYYLFKLGASDSYLDSTATASDRAAIVAWLTRSLLKQGVWGSGVDTLLTRLRVGIDNADLDRGFPIKPLEMEMAALGKPLTFDDTEIDALLSSAYNAPRTFAILALLYPGLDMSKTFHEDHIFPKALFTSKRLTAAGVPEVTNYLEAYNLLPNLQLLGGTANTEKQAKLPTAWIATLADSKRSTYLAENDLDDLSLDLAEFLAFVDGRRSRIRLRLLNALGNPDIK